MLVTNHADGTTTSLKLGDTVDLILGCDNTYTTCLNKFNNLINFGGFMFLPATNPYINPV